MCLQKPEELQKSKFKSFVALCEKIKHSKI